LFKGFLIFWGVVFAVTTTIIALFKHEVDEHENTDESHFGLVETYKVLLKVLRLPSVRSLGLILLTIKVYSERCPSPSSPFLSLQVSFAAVDAMTGLELIERGVSKDSLALLAIPLTPLEILLPFCISHYTTGSKPLNLDVKSHPFR
jgi:MFS transporter, PAT family, solute carrier family 33 (acetyl-CoA transportor), member 1